MAKHEDTTLTPGRFSILLQAQLHLDHGAVAAWNAHKSEHEWDHHVEKALQELIDADRHQVVLDLQDTEYMSSAGLRVLVSTLKAAKKSGGDLKLAQLSGRVKEVLDLAGLTPVFKIHGDVIEAVGSF